MAGHSRNPSLAIAALVDSWIISLVLQPYLGRSRGFPSPSLDGVLGVLKGGVLPQSWLVHSPDELAAYDPVFTGFQLTLPIHPFASLLFPALACDRHCSPPCRTPRNSADFRLTGPRPGLNSTRMNSNPNRLAITTSTLRSSAVVFVPAMSTQSAEAGANNTFPWLLVMVRTLCSHCRSSLG